MRTSSRAAALTIVGLMALAGCGSSSSPKSTTAATKPAAAAIEVRLTDEGCDPATLTAVAGDVTFAVTNSISVTDARSEFELVSSAPKIVTEELLEKGASGSYTLALAAGTYQVICGAPSYPRGTLTVSGDGGSTGSTLKVDAAALQANVDAYTTYVDGQLDEMVASNNDLLAAITAGDLTKAQALYMPARVQWERIEPIAELFPDSDAAMDSRVDDFTGPTDPRFTGWHRLEYLMFDQQTLDGALAFDEQLVKDIADLVTKVHSVTIDAATMVNGSAGLIEEASSGKITGEEERYAGTSLLTLASNVEGAREIVDLNADLLQGVDAKLYDDIIASFDAIDKGLSKYANGDGTYKPYDELTDADRAPIQAELAMLSENLALVAGAFGLQVS